MRLLQIIRDDNVFGEHLRSTAQFCSTTYISANRWTTFCFGYMQSIQTVNTCCQCSSDTKRPEDTMNCRRKAQTTSVHNKPMVLHWRLNRDPPSHEQIRCNYWLKYHVYDACMLCPVQSTYDHINGNNWTGTLSSRLLWHWVWERASTGVAMVAARLRPGRAGL
jgi:hypothetical protein